MINKQTLFVLKDQSPIFGEEITRLKKYKDQEEKNKRHLSGLKMILFSDKNTKSEGLFRPSSCINLLGENPNRNKDNKKLFMRGSQSLNKFIINEEVATSSKEQKNLFYQTFDKTKSLSNICEYYKYILLRLFKKFKE